MMNGRLNTEDVKAWLAELNWNKTAKGVGTMFRRFFAAIDRIR